MGRKDRRIESRKSHANPPSRKTVKADRRVLIVLFVVALAIVLATFFARNAGLG